MVKRALKIFGWVAGITLLLLVAAVNFIPVEYFKESISSLVRQATAGRDLVIGGDIDIEFGSHIKITASDVKFSNPDSASRLHMFTGEHIEVDVKLMPLLGGTLDVRMVVQAADLLLERYAEGNANWQLSGSPSPGKPIGSASHGGGLSLSLFIRELRLDGAKVAYIHKAVDRSHTATFETILLRSLGDRTIVEIDGQIDGHALSLKGGTIETDQSESDSSPGFNLEGKLADVGLKVRGTLAALSTNADADLVVDASVPSLSVLSGFVGRDLPDDGPLTATFNLVNGSGHFSVTDLKANLKTKLLTASVMGRTGNLHKLAGIDLRVAVQTARLPAVVKRFGIELPAELPDLSNLNASANVVSQSGTIAAHDIGIKLSGDEIKASAKGSVGDLLGIKEIDTNVQLELASLAQLNKLARLELPNSGPLSLSSKLSNVGGLDSRSSISGNIKGDGVLLSFNGSIDDLLSAKGVAMAVDLKGESLRKAAKLVGREISQEDPISLKGNLNFDGNKLEADGLILKVADAEVTGDLNYTLNASEKERSKLTAKLDLKSLDLESIFGPLFGTASGSPPAGDSTAQTVDAETEPAARPGRPREATETQPQSRRATKQVAAEAKKFFPDTQLPFELLRGMDADIDISADEFSTWMLRYKNVAMMTDLTGGVLKLSLKTDVGNGKAWANAEVDASKSPASLSLDIEITDGTFRHFGGRYNMKTNVSGAGNSPAKIMAGLDGEMIVDVRDLTLEKTFMTNFGRSLLDTLNPLKITQEKDKLVCSVARFDIKDGVADATDQFVAQMKDVTWFGGGTIDFKSEGIDLGARSKPRKGLGISSAGSLAGLVYVGGTLAQPAIMPDPKGVVEQYGRIYLSVTTGGLWLLLEGLQGTTSANSDVCAKILANKPVTESGPLRALFDSGNTRNLDQTSIPSPVKSDSTEAEFDFGGDK